MTKQCVYPFIVNGQFWKKQQIDVEMIKRGEIFFLVAEKLSAVMMKDFDECSAACIHMKQVRFRLVKVAESRGRFIARWFEAFWLSDNDVYLEESNLYKRERQ